MCHAQDWSFFSSSSSSGGVLALVPALIPALVSAFVPAPATLPQAVREQDIEGVVLEICGVEVELDTSTPPGSG